MSVTSPFPERRGMEELQLRVMPGDDGPGPLHRLSALLKPAHTTISTRKYGIPSALP